MTSTERAELEAMCDRWGNDKTATPFVMLCLPAAELRAWLAKQEESESASTKCVDCSAEIAPYQAYRCNACVCRQFEQHLADRAAQGFRDEEPC
jgi:hypothetical protein